MASDTATASPETEAPPRRRLWPQGSRLGRLIIALNFLGLAILVIGALTLNELRRGLVNARIDSLITQGEWIARLINETATVGEPEPTLQAERAAVVLQLLHLPSSQRVRLFDREGRLIADSYFVADRVDWKPLPPARKPGQKAPAAERNPTAERAARELKAELDAARRGEPVKGRRMSEGGEQLVSVSLPIQRVRAVVGVLTLEAGDVDEIIAAERAALIPFILIAVAVTLLSSSSSTSWWRGRVLPAGPGRRPGAAGAGAIDFHARPGRAPGRDRRPDPVPGTDDRQPFGADGRHRALRRRRGPRDPQSADLDPVGGGNPRSGRRRPGPRTAITDCP